MPLRVACGSYRALERALAARLREHPPSPGRPAALVAPSRRLARRLGRVLAVDNGLALAGLRLHTFFSLALELCEGEDGPPGRLVSDGLFHELIVRSLLSRGGRLAGRGLAGAWREAIKDLEDAGLEEDAYREHLSGLLPEDEERGVLGLLELGARVRRALGSLGVLSASDLARAARSRAAAARRYAEIAYYGFYDLTGIQADLLEAVGAQTECRVYYPYVKDDPAYEFARTFFESKLQGPDVSHLPPADDAAPPAPRIISACGAGDQAWAAAKEVARLRRSGVPYGEIGVVARTLEPFRAALEEAFADNEIPVSMGAEEPLLRRPVAALAHRLLTWARNDFPVRDILDLLDSPYLRRERFGRPGRRDPLRSFKALAAASGVHSGWLQWEGRVAPWAERDFPLGPAEAPSAFIKAADVAPVWEFVKDLRGALSGERRAPWESHLARARSLLSGVLELEGDPAGSALLEAVDSLEPFAALFPEPSWDLFLDVLGERLARAALPAPPESRGVRVLDAMDARGESFRALVMIGLNEGLFPRQVREHPLLSDSARGRLRDHGGWWLRPKLEGYQEEKLLFHLAAASARESLSCVYSRSDEEGRAQVPSLYLRELARQAGRDLDSEPDWRVPRPPLARLRSAPSGLWTPREFALDAARAGKAAAAVLEAGGRDGALAGVLAELEGLRRGGEPGPLDGMIGRGGHMKELEARGLSPTALDQLSRCPFQFFASRLLGLGQGEEPAPPGELSPRALGKLYHKVLERFYARLRDSGYWEAARPGDWRAALKASLDETFRELGWRQVGLYPLLWESLRRRVEAHLEAFAAADMAELAASGFAPRHLEEELRGSAWGVKLKGRPDRIDVSRDGGSVRVVDYKSAWGSRPALARQAARLRANQPLAYLELAAARWGEAAPAGAAFYVIEEPPGDGGPARQTLPARSWKAARTGLGERIAALVEGARRGEFPIVPEAGLGGACAWCDFPLVCRKSHPATRRRAEESRWRLEFDRLHEGDS